MMTDIIELPRFRAHDVLRVRRRLRGADRGGAAGDHGHRAAREAAQGARGYVLIGIFVIAAFLTPPDAISQCIMAVPMYLLYEGGLIMARILMRMRREQPARPRANADRRALQPCCCRQASVTLGRPSQRLTAARKRSGSTHDRILLRTTVVAPSAAARARRVPRPSARPRDALHDRVVRALHLLRHARACSCCSWWRRRTRRTRLRNRSHHGRRHLRSVHRRVFLGSLPGGWIADRLIGAQRACAGAASSSCSATSCSRFPRRRRSSISASPSSCSASAC